MKKNSMKNFLWIDQIWQQFNILHLRLLPVYRSEYPRKEQTIKEYLHIP